MQTTNDLPPYDPTEGYPIPVFEISEHESIARIPVSMLLDLVPDPVKAEKAGKDGDDPVLAPYQVIRAEVQRAVVGAKKRNSVAFGEYIVEGIRGLRPWAVPAITLFSVRHLRGCALKTV